MASNTNMQGYGSDPASPHTTFVQADPSNFRAIVQRLTGAPEDPSAHKLPLTLPSRLTPKPPPAASVSDAGLRRPAFKLHERRQRKLDMIQLNNHKNIGFYADTKHVLASPPPPPASSLSPTWLRQYGKRGGEAVMVSPVSPLDLFGRASPRTPTPTTPTLLSPREEEEAEERAIAEKGFYLRPSTPRQAEPELLPLFPLHSPSDQDRPS
ncbi:VQ motif-containing protein 11-like [Rhodamnia argentea]|uniref:VQ motif-containing protein 11-like n=1 Tax=Rhodamnia argentea TaxID=178133 RepID=A0A8B8NRQ4_9MYRT|nr:VQ motif-containing protein 11-like [Rhodamnia argentea]